MGLVEIIKEAFKSTKQRKIEELNLKILKLESEIATNLKNYKNNEQRLKNDLMNAISDHDLIESKYQRAIHIEDRELHNTKEDLEQHKLIVKQQREEIENLKEENKSLMLKAS